MKVTFIQNSTMGGPGLLGQFFADAGWSVHRLVSYHEILDQSFAALEADCVVILGSPRGVYETAEAWIAREHEMVDHLLARRIPMFGICFGAQLLAKVLGGHVAAMPEPFHDWIENDVVPDELWRGPWLRWHGDRIFPSDRTETIATDRGVLQAFHSDTSFGVQFHPEATQDILGAWIGSLPDAQRDDARRGALAFYAAHEEAIRRRSFALFSHVLRELGITP